MVALLKNIKGAIAHWWSEFTLQTRLMAAATLAVSLIMSSLTFWAVNTIQLDARLHDTRFGQDLGLLLASNVTPLVAENNLTEVARFSQRFYNSTSNIRYLLYADRDGRLFFGLPFWDSEVQTSLSIERRIQLPENYITSSQIPLVRQHKTPDGEVTDVFVPLIDDNKYLGVLAIGINPNPTVVTSSNLTRDVTLAVFVSIWSMVILGGVFNALAITQPIKELLAGVKSIAAGNFKQRIDLPLSGELGELICSFNDMAERLENYDEQNIEELTAEKAKLETLVSTIADGAILLDTDLNIILVNPNARRMFDWDGESVVGKNVLRYVPPPLQVKLTRPLYEIVQGKFSPSDGASIYEFRITLTEPVKRTVRILLTTVLSHRATGENALCLDCLHDANDTCVVPERPLAQECVLYEHHIKPNLENAKIGNLKGIAITVQDITREVELNEAKSQFISNVSHELRTPLFNIKGFIETLYEYGEELSDVERRDFLETANHETDRLTRLVNDVLDLSRLESSRTYHLDAVYVGQLIEQTLRTYQLNAKDKGIELRQEIEADLPKIWGHYDLLLQVLTNLVGNSLKFTESQGKVMIRAYCPQSNKKVVRIEVADTGIGIDTEDQATIFDRFYRVENRVHTLEGTGLGLSIVRNIIDKHNSCVQLVSEVGVGTTFWFDLALYEEAIEPEPVSPLEPVYGGSPINS
ncbi:MAG: HAMP domain-containing protein [Roseofilum sp. SBFL]|uniref:ATP-binding protein n=1 Tax=unclassified Roseofilum TaxID=2620099 RepID=UPI001B15759F|nr:MULTISPECIES: ATP-binding protein [unclassified Roseofilum]MBP0015467.1 HAMP domain-containing protein [Roseofilum sp. SID3]MBP0023215.1 HAMP domain-containing protein [Roseofilum sp. SID2]MBP0039893.1 HAMP domain-containing protein [Roseofilum sp. SID1]MBP0041503.1 HAMP domain-containing protein [Roseofilum sp. SBFL]